MNWKSIARLRKFRKFQIFLLPQSCDSSHAASWNSYFTLGSGPLFYNVAKHHNKYVPIHFVISIAAKGIEN